MNADDLRALQAPLKDKYREAPEAALITLTARGELDADGVACRVDTGKALIEAGLHPATGGTGSACLFGQHAPGRARGLRRRHAQGCRDRHRLRLEGGVVSAEGDLDFRGTLGVAKDAPVGFRDIRLTFELKTGEPQERIDQLIKLTERYCVSTRRSRSLRAWSNGQG